MVPTSTLQLKFRLQLSQETIPRKQVHSTLMFSNEQQPSILQIQGMGKYDNGGRKNSRSLALPFEKEMQPQLYVFVIVYIFSHQNISKKVLRYYLFRKEYYTSISFLRFSTKSNLLRSRARRFRRGVSCNAAL